MSKSSEAVAACRRQIEAQLDKVRTLNASEAPIDAVSSEVAALQALSAQLGELSLSKKGGQKGKITLKTVLTHQVMSKVKFSPPSKFKNKNKPKTTLKMIK